MVALRPGAREGDSVMAECSQSPKTLSAAISSSSRWCAADAALCFEHDLLLLGELARVLDSLTGPPSGVRVGSAFARFSTQNLGASTVGGHSRGADRENSEQAAHQLFPC
jgi:hypothetical protein